MDSLTLAVVTSFFSVAMLYGALALTFVVDKVVGSECPRKLSLTAVRSVCMAYDTSLVLPGKLHIVRTDQFKSPLKQARIWPLLKTVP